MGRTSWHASVEDPPATEASPRGWFEGLSRRGRAVTVSLLALAGLAVIVGLGALFMRWHYGTWPWAAYPSELHYCGSTYDRRDEGLVPRIFDRAQGKDVAEPIYTAFTYRAPLVDAHPVFADTAKGDHVGDSTECASFLFIKTTGDRVIPYQING